MLITRQELGLVIEAAHWHTGDLGLILGRVSLHPFGCIPQRLGALFGVDIATYKNLFF
jgi:hypothetical protein